MFRENEKYSVLIDLWSGSIACSIICRMIRTFENIRIAEAAVIGTGFSGFTYKVVTETGEELVATISPVVQETEDNELALTHRLCQILDIEEPGLLTQGYLLPIGLLERSSTVEVKLQDAITRYSKARFSDVQREITQVEKMYGIDPLTDAQRFITFLINDPYIFKQFNGVDIDPQSFSKTLTEVAKFSFPYSLKIYPHVKGALSLKDIIALEGYSRSDFAFPKRLELIEWLTSQVALLEKAGFVHGDLGLGNILSHNNEWLLADHKDCKPMSYKSSVKDKSRFIWTVQTLLCTVDLNEELKSIIESVSTFGKDVNQAFLSTWIGQFLHGVELQHVFPGAKSMENQSQLITRFLRQSGYSEKLIQFLERFPYMNRPYDTFLQDLRKIIDDNPQTKQKKKRKRH